MQWTNLATLQARLDPHYQLKLQQIQNSVAGEQYRAHAAMEREQVKASAAMERERFRANEAWQLADTQARRDDQREQLRGQTALELSRQEHGQRLEALQADLEGRARLAGLESGILAVHKLMDADNERRMSLHRQLEERSKLRGEVFKMLAGAVIQEKLAQRQHTRDLEKLQVESELRRADAYMASVTAYLTGLMDKGRADDAKAEIDRLLSEWAESG